ncbi:GTP cyclohydrolase-2 [Coccomyxa sp. Obi]|nr:GTP cyclohydrolase-2 [Coccomyxa sp. Obi]
MQGLGTPLPNHQSKSLSTLASEPYDVTEFVAETLLPTRTGKYRLRGYRHTFDGGRTYTEPSVIMTGTPENGTEIPVRVHDACFTSEVLGSLKCDCAGQLQMAMSYIQENGPGLIIYLQQEGRGIGLANKIAAYALQEEGLDTVDANRALGLPDDCREYSSVRNILQNLGIRSIRLMTNNPRKIKVLEELGVMVTARIPCIVEAQEHNIGYLATKQARMSHWMEDGANSLDGSYCYWNHDGEPLKPSMKGPPSSPHSNGKLIGRPAS